MCGRYILYHSRKSVADRFAVTNPSLDFEPRYNIAPTQMVTAIVEREEREITSFRWGLIPFWAKDARIGSQLINARAETIGEKPSFKNALAKRRCLIPSDGWYEWQKRAGGSQPYLLSRKDGDLFGFAGLWEEWKSPEQEVVRTCTIITVEANELLSRVHHRMPAILRREHEAEWLDPGAHYIPGLTQLLQSYPDDELEARPVSKAVNSPANDSASLIDRVDFSLK